MKPLPVLFWEIGSPDPERAKRFYAEVCGWGFGPPDELGYSPARGSLEGIPGGIFDTKGDRPFGMIFVKVPDLNQWIEQAERNGGTLLIPPTQVPELASFFAVISDPDGNRLGLFWDPSG